MGNEARDVRLQDRDVKRRPVALARCRLDDFKRWLEAAGWHLDGTIGDYEMVRAWRGHGGGRLRRAWLFVYDGPDAANVLLFDMAAREAERFAVACPAPVDGGGPL